MELKKKRCEEYIKNKIRINMYISNIVIEDLIIE